MLTFKIDGTEHQYDDSKMMFSEAMEIQKATGQNAKVFEQGLLDGDAYAYGAMFWLAQLRAIVQDQRCTLKEAVKQLPFADWDINLAEPIGSMRRVVEPDPTEAPSPDGSAETTSPATSELPPAESPSIASAADTSASSPSSSASAPGSGTA